MSDYGYRPGPSPDEGRPNGGQQGGRAYGGASGNAGSGQPDYGWGGQQGQGGSPPRPQQPYGTPASGSASVGRGSASVGGSGGRASVGGASGAASVGGAGRSGRASVGSASVGSASVGSASVGSASVGSASVGGSRPPGRDDDRTGRAAAGGRRRAGKGPVGEGDLDGKSKAAKKKRRRKKVLAALIAVGVLFVAGVTMVTSYFFVDVKDPGSIARAGESTSFYFADGSEAGGYGEKLRLQATEEQIPDTVKNALVATEDRKFWDHSGVDFTRTVGALVNNLTGGSTQGASTITQQYAGMVLEIRDEISYDRKAREAAMAMKMESKYSKEQIITAYLNLAYFGRGATGIEAAAKVYFDKPLADLTPGEAAYIVMQVKSPNGTYDPYYTDYYDEDATVARWDYSMQAMVDMGDLSQADKDAAEMPVPISEFNSAGSWGGNTDIGFIINEQDGYVFEELQERYGISKEELYGGKDSEDGEGGEGGYSVTLTIDPQIQNALSSTGSRGLLAVKTDDEGNYLNADGEIVEKREDAALDKNDEGYVYFENTNEDAALKEYEEYMTTAMVAIEPETGAVLGYYGGDNGFGVDKAGAESPHPPSSTFKMVTAATAIMNGDSIDSWFNASSPRQFDSLTLDDSESCIGGGDYPDCSLRNGGQNSKTEMTLTDSVRKSKNTPMYAIAEHYGASQILNYADLMGLQEMSQTRQAQDDTGGTHSVPVMYHLTGNGTYTQHGEAKDAEGEWVVDEKGGIRKDTPVLLDGNCNPVVNTEGTLLADPDGEADECAIGDKGNTDPFYNHISFGQYPTSVASMAAIYATIANDGVYNETHYVAKVVNNKGEEVLPKEELESEQAISTEAARDLQWVGSEISGEESTGLEFSRAYFGKTGTWEAGCDECEESWNAHAWYTGAIPQLAIAAWVGNATSESDPIADPDGNKNNVYGSNTAYPVWYEAMTRLIEAKGDAEGWDEQEWGEPTRTGSENNWDIEAAGAIEGGPFCADNPESTLCKASQEEQAKQECEDGGGTWDGETCQPGEGEDDPDQPTDGVTETPTDGEGGDNCPVLNPNCNDDGGGDGETASPDPENTTTPEGDGGWGG